MKILFVCSGNTCRSPMAQALFKREAEKRGIACEAKSAGIITYTGNPASDLAAEVMKEIGIDISGFRSTSIRSILAEDFDLYVPMTDSHARALVELGIGKHRIYMFDREIADPYGGGIEHYRAARDQLAKYMPKLADFVIKMIAENENGKC